MKKRVWGNTYRGYTVMADIRVHEKTVEILKKRYGNGNIQMLDIACGEGALSRRIKDEFPGWQIDVNDFDADKIKFKEYNDKFCCDLNKPVSFKKQYDVIIAIEIIEHLENPWAFLREIGALLKKGGLAVVSTPNINSVRDRIFFLIEGYHIYFGARGIRNSGGHINMMPRWELEYICSRTGLTIQHVDSVGEMPSGWRTRVLKLLLLPFFPFMKDRNNASIYIFSLSC
jgi:2-polyprenyl-3-methyl-5-hydroxy-6-metoxy-1,4-benzoquinol methylase